MPKRISPKEAHELMKQGYVYVDVRSEQEFEASHPEGAVNIPFMHKGAMGMSPNPEFLPAFKKAFKPGDKVILGCAGGNRSMRAAEALERDGYDELVEQRAGFGGARDMAGQLVEPGWESCGLPCEAGAPEGRSWKSHQAQL
ncbi:rhodanese-like domain-containing protein [Vulgatibacter sp.]|uniref:rhodanese-like domain-containing protein n=1 Tax=Vulgatibacter sp. TaxID=1971226 RepID=UPI0035683A36